MRTYTQRAIHAHIQQHIHETKCSIIQPRMRTRFHLFAHTTYSDARNHNTSVHSSTYALARRASLPPSLNARCSSRLFSAQLSSCGAAVGVSAQKREMESNAALPQEPRRALPLRTWHHPAVSPRWFLGPRTCIRTHARARLGRSLNPSSHAPRGTSFFGSRC